jgi:uncharacterized protein YndB with AHSA1/START domain
MNRLLYSVEREYPVPLSRLWRAWVDAAALEQWYCPTDLAVLPGSVVSEPVVGGWWTVGVDVAAHDFVAYFYGKYTDVVDQHRLVHTLYYTQSEVEFAARDLAAPHHEILIDFEDRGEQSWARFTQYGDLPADEAPRAKAGMESYFDNLGSYLAAHG